MDLTTKILFAISIILMVFCFFVNPRPVHAGVVGTYYGSGNGGTIQISGTTDSNGQTSTTTCSSDGFGNVICY